MRPHNLFTIFSSLFIRQQVEDRDPTRGEKHNQTIKFSSFLEMALTSKSCEQKQTRETESALSLQSWAVELYADELTMRFFRWARCEGQSRGRGQVSDRRAGKCPDRQHTNALILLSWVKSDSCVFWTTWRHHEIQAEPCCVVPLLFFYADYHRHVFWMDFYFFLFLNGCVCHRIISRH